ncbi:MAG: phytanoyl-CoA dioxygenase family protein [Bacteroidota bacterium]
MQNQKQIIEEMMRGYAPLEEFSQNLRLRFRQRCKVGLLMFVIALYRTFVLPLRKRKTRELETGLKRCTNLGIEVPRYALPCGTDTHFMDEEQIRDFEQNGMVRPFRVMDETEAHALRKKMEQEFAQEFRGNLFIEGELADTLREHDDLHIGMAGLYQALQYKELREVLTAPPIAHRMASILGPEVICWRSQFFKKGPGADGTFWHQTGAFREVSKMEKLVPTKDISHGILQLTAWVALSDVTVDTACLRIIPGSFQDGRIEFLQAYVQDNMIDYLARLPRKSLPRLIKAALFSSGSFIRSQALFETIPIILKDIFWDRKVEDLEMKAGEAVIFTSMNLHASYPNVSADRSRFAFAGRYTANHVKVFPGMTHSYQGTPDGIKSFPLDRISSIQVYGKDSYGYNKIYPETGSEIRLEAPVATP